MVKIDENHQGFRKTKAKHGDLSTKVLWGPRREKWWLLSLVLDFSVSVSLQIILQCLLLNG